MKKSASKKTFCGIILLLLLVGITSTALAKDPPQTTSYLQYPPSQTFAPLSIWNPLITERDGKVAKRSYFQYGPDDKVLESGSLWNPLITGKKGDK